MQKNLKHETRILLLTLLSGAPAVALSLGLMWWKDFSDSTRWVVSVVVLTVWWGLARAVHERVIRPLQTASNLLSALREEDFSIRARTPRRDDALRELMEEVNALRQTLREQPLGALGTSALARTLMTAIEDIVFTFHENQPLQATHRTGESPPY